jgi:Xaa-Pro aminopeptidase
VTAVLPAGSLIGIDPKLMSTSAFRDLKQKLEKSDYTKYELVSVQDPKGNLVDQVWQELSSKPEAPAGEIFSLAVTFAGESYQSKLARMREEMSKSDIDFLVMTSLDEIAWLLNLRGSDIAYNPLFFSYVLLSQDKLYFYVDKSKFNQEAAQQLEKDSSITVLPYESFLQQEELKERLLIDGKTTTETRVLVDVSTCNWAVMELLQAAGVTIVEKESPVKLTKTIKNETEVQGMRNCHIRDGAALVKLFSWLEK